jgi:diketogulonate reductase-like aldo/keto reductase
MENLVFGTYKINSIKDLSTIVELSKKYKIHNIDTAQLYRNEENLSKLIDLDARITTKISKDKNPSIISKYIEKTSKLFDSKLSSILIHHPMEISTCRVLKEECIKRSITMGVSNYTVSDLEKLESFGIIPHVNQIEFHPFVPVYPMLNYCKSRGIKIQGHTILCRGKFFNYPPLLSLARKYNISPAQLMIKWGLQHGINVCLNSLKEDHVREWVEIASSDDWVINSQDFGEMNSFYSTMPYRFYKNIKRPLVYMNLPIELDAYIKELSIKLQKDFQSITENGNVSDTCLLKSLKDPVVFDKLCKDLEVNTEYFQVKLKNLRKYYETHKFPKIKSCVFNPNKNYITNPEAMPVDVTDPIEFKPIFDYLKDSSMLSSTVTFIKGTMFYDGRLDMCKQVVGPTSIQELCITVKNSHNKVKHFLLGNNIAFGINETLGVTALSKLITDNTLDIQTWYLAGNCITEIGVEIISSALQINKRANALWLKRNMVGETGTLYLKNMLNVNKTLECLDLNNCGLMNRGLENLCNGLNNTTLKHLYLDCNGLTSLDPLIDCIDYLELETLFLSMNVLLPDQITRLFKKLDGNKYIKRLNFASCELKDAKPFEYLNCPNLIMLDIGYYKATKDLGLKPNEFDRDQLEIFKSTLKRHKNIQYFSLYGSGNFEASDFERNITTCTTKSGTIYAPDHNSEHIKKRVKNFDLVDNIDSIYRGK